MVEFIYVCVWSCDVCIWSCDVCVWSCDVCVWSCDVLYGHAMFVYGHVIFVYGHVMFLFQQVANFQLLFCEAIYGFIPFFWITIFIVLFEGFMGGAVYANAFYYITKQVCILQGIRS